MMECKGGLNLIAFIEGLVAGLDGDCAVIAAGGIGYKILMPASALQSLPAPGSPIRVYTHMYVREDNIGLFGFLTRDDLKMFRQLITVSGIGPKAALQILSVMSVDELRMAIVAEDVKRITAAPGVGPKSARRVIIELKDKIDLDEITGRVSTGAEDASSAADDQAVKDTILALTALGYSNTDAVRAVRAVEDAENLSSEALLKAALRNITIF